MNLPRSFHILVREKSIGADSIGENLDFGFSFQTHSMKIPVSGAFFTLVFAIVVPAGAALKWETTEAD